MRGRREPVDLTAFQWWVQVEVRYGDLDPQGRVNNAVYFTYFEQARVDFLNAARARIEEEHRQGNPHDLADGDTAPRLDSADFPFVVTSAACAYYFPITALSPVAVGIRYSHASHATIELQYALCDQPHGRIYATGATTLVSVDPVTGRPRALPDWMRESLKG